MDEVETMKTISGALCQVKTTLRDLQQEWQEIQAVAVSALQPQQWLEEDDVLIRKTDLDNLASEAEQMKNSVSKVMNKTTLALLSDASKMKDELEAMRTERNSLISDVNHWKTQLNTALSEAQKEKQEQLELRVDIQELTGQLTQQSEFCSSLGASCCTLLWRVSRNQDSVHNIIAGNRSEEFLALTSNSIHSFLQAYKDDQWPEQANDEAVFLLALCGTITNVAASAEGREYLASQTIGQRVMDSFIQFISEAPLGRSCPMKNLMLMSLYNLSINQKGLAYLGSKQGLVAMLSRHLKDETVEESRAGTLRLLQSLISEEANSRLVHELKENLSLEFLHNLSKTGGQEVKDLTLDLIMDLRHCGQ